MLDLSVPQDVTIGGEFFFGSGAPGQGAIAIVDDLRPGGDERARMRVGPGARARAPLAAGGPLLHPRRAHLELLGVPRARREHRHGRASSRVRPVLERLHRGASSGRGHAPHRGPFPPAPRRKGARLRASVGGSERQLLHLRHDGRQRGGRSRDRHHAADRRVFRVQHRRRERRLPRDVGAHLPGRRGPRRAREHPPSRCRTSARTTSPFRRTRPPATSRSKSTRWASRLPEPGWCGAPAAAGPASHPSVKSP